MKLWHIIPVVSSCLLPEGIWYLYFQAFRKKIRQTELVLPVQLLVTLSQWQPPATLSLCLFSLYVFQVVILPITASKRDGRWSQFYHSNKTFKLKNFLILIFAMCICDPWRVDPRRMDVSMNECIVRKSIENIQKEWLMPPNLYEFDITHEWSSLQIALLNLFYVIMFHSIKNENKKYLYSSAALRSFK